MSADNDIVCMYNDIAWSCSKVITCIYIANQLLNLSPAKPFIDSTVTPKIHEYKCGSIFPLRNKHNSAIFLQYIYSTDYDT